MPMNQGVKAQWGEWLLAHEADQGTGALCRKRDDGKEELCCLGGLCELARAAGVVTRVLDEGTGNYAYGAPGEHPEQGVLPVSVMRWAHLDSTNPVMSRQYPGYSLAELNDHGTSFRAIWDLIREHL